MDHKKGNSPKRKTFKEAVAATPQVKNCHKEGKQAILGKERDKVSLADATKCGGSLFIDQCLIDQKLHPNANRWDYAIDYDGEVYFFEIHSAKTDQVSKVIKKLEWLQEWLHTTGSEIYKLRAKTPYFWVQSDGYHILPRSAEQALAAQNGIRPIARLMLPLDTGGKKKQKREKQKHK